MLEAEHLSVTYGAHRALEDVSVHVGASEICVILGANGAGKSTLLKAIAGLVHIAPGGQVTIDGHAVTGKKPNLIVEKGIALVPEGRGIFSDLTVAENLELGAYGVQARASREGNLNEVLGLFPKLLERKHQIVRTMSGGEQQMVAIGRALMSNPKILMLDEPSLGLSPLLASELFKSLKLVRDAGVGILLVEQNAKQSLKIADRAYLLENGHITGQGRAEVLANDPAVQKAYLGGTGKDVHKRLGETEAFAPAHVPVRKRTDQPETAADLATRASTIHRAYIEAKRHGGVNGHAGMNGHASKFVDERSQTAEPIMLSDQAEELSQKAEDMATRASKILAAYVIAQRQAAATAPQAHMAAAMAKPKKSKKDAKPVLAKNKAQKAESSKKSKKAKKAKKKK